MAQQKKSVLGRGLSALIPRASLPEVSVHKGGVDSGETGVIVSVEVSKIQPNPYQPRVEFDESALDELRRSIVEKGVIQPITVRRVEGGYQLISGERRLRAAQKAGLRRVPAYVIEVKTDAEMLELALIENIQREHLNAIEIAQAYERLMTECNLSQEEIAKKVGKDRTTVTNFLRLLKLPEPIQLGIRKDKITMGHARALLALPNEKAQVRFYQKIVDGGLSVRKVEEMVRSYGKTTGGRSSPGRSTPTDGASSIRNVEEKIRQALGTKVSVRSHGSGRGEIVISFYSLDDLDRLLDLFAEIEKRR
ncbi:MAG TPA: ParB/RepB/Spo0J family partition protein [Bacteroidota bacterium]|nr:ParB/RepB/Spo0J family partition protein [Bacteroidota bacterium]